MINFKYLLIIISLINSTIFCMENFNKNDTENTNMKIIQSLKDLEPYLKHIIAYKTTTYELGSSQGYSICNDNSTKYGYISSSTINWIGGEGYNMSQLIESKDVGSGHALTNLNLKGQSLSIRYATTEEIALIRQAIESQKARFESVFGKNAKICSLLKITNTINPDL